MVKDARQQIIEAEAQADIAGLRFELKALGLPQGETEFGFSKSRKWRFDLAWPTKRLALEVEGGVWKQGRHTRGSGFMRDMEKYNEAALAGWKLLRVTPHMVKDGSALALVRRAL